MRLRAKLLVLVLLSLGLFLTTAAQAQVQTRDEAALRACLAANLVDGPVAQDIAITQTDASGQVRRLAGRWHWQGREAEPRGMLKLSAPADLAGAAYLVIRKAGSDVFYVYLPSIGKARKVEGATLASSLFGSGLSAFDLKFLFSGLSGGSFTRIGPDKAGSRSGERWRYQPPSDPNILYDKVELLIDDQWCLPLSVEFYGGVPWKTLSIDPATVQQSGSRWLARRFFLNDQRTGSRSEIRLGAETSDDALSAALFDPARFYRQQ